MEIDEQMDECNRICPYCAHSYQVEAENYSEDRREEECENCGKKFYAWDSFTVTHYSKPDCKLNGLEHTFSPYEKDKSFNFCNVCGKCVSDRGWL